MSDKDPATRRPAKANLRQLGVKGTIGVGLIAVSGWGIADGGAERVGAAVGPGFGDAAEAALEVTEGAAAAAFDEITADPASGEPQPSNAELERSIEEQKQQNQINAAYADGELPPTNGVPEQPR